MTAEVTSIGSGRVGGRFVVYRWDSDDALTYQQVVAAVRQKARADGFTVLDVTSVVGQEDGTLRIEVWIK